MPDFSAPPPGWAGPPGSGPGLGPMPVPGPQGQNMMGPRMQQMPPRMPPHGMGPAQMQGQSGGPPFSSNYQFPPPGVPPPVGGAGGGGMPGHPGDRQHHGSMPQNQFGFPPPFGRPGGSGQMPPQLIQQAPNKPNIGGPQWEKPT